MNKHKRSLRSLSRAELGKVRGGGEGDSERKTAAFTDFYEPTPIRLPANPLKFQSESP